MTFPRLVAMQEQWKYWPPAPVCLALLASAHGMKLPKRPDKKGGTSLQDLLQAVKGG